jgi:hypothetical protein
VEWLRPLPLRKLMVLVVTVIDVFFMIPAMSRGDLPSGVLALLMTMTGAVYGGYFGTSTIEHCKSKKYAREAGIGDEIQN